MNKRRSSTKAQKPYNQTEILELKTTINILKNLIGASTSDSIEQNKEPVNSKTTHLKVVRGSLKKNEKE